MTHVDRKNHGRETRTLPRSFLVAIMSVASLALFLAPVFFNQGDLRLIIEILTVFTFAQTWNLLAGYSGLLSFGQQLFIGLGAYFVFLVSNETGLNPFLLLPFSFIFSSLCAAIISPLVFRLRDAYFAIGLWVLAEVTRLYTSQHDWLGSVSGMSLVTTREMDKYWVTLGNYWAAALLAVLSVAGFYWLMMSRLGFSLMAVRDNEKTASAVGINVWWTRFAGFVLSAGICGASGATYYMSVYHVDPGAAYDANWVVVMLFIVIIGGVGTIEGPLFGTAIYFLLRAFLAADGPPYLILMGAAAVITLLFSPKGIAGLIAKHFNIEIFSTRRVMPSSHTRKTA